MSNEMGGVEIDCAIVCYRSDDIRGISFSIQFRPGDGVKLAQKCERMMLFLDNRDPAKAIRWMQEYTTNLCVGLEDKDVDYLIATLYWLERRGHIQSNNYNGIMWLGHMTNGCPFVIRQDEPDEEQLRYLKERLPNVEMQLRVLNHKQFDELIQDTFRMPKRD